MAKSSKPTWSQIKARIKLWDKAQLMGLIQGLFGHSQDNRNFLAARLLRDSLGEQAGEPVRPRTPRRSPAYEAADAMGIVPGW